MKWMANVTVLGDDMSGERRFALFPIEADSEADAARAAAREVAKTLYGAGAEIGFVAPQVPDAHYIVTCGLYQGNGLTRGRSLSIKIDTYEGKQ